MWVALCCILTVTAVLSTLEGLILAAIVLVLYVVVLGLRRQTLAQTRPSQPWLAWLCSAVDEEELELVVAIRPPRGRPVRPLSPQPRRSSSSSFRASSWSEAERNWAIISM